MVGLEYNIRLVCRRFPCLRVSPTHKSCIYCNVSQFHPQLDGEGDGEGFTLPLDIVLILKCNVELSWLKKVAEV